MEQRETAVDEQSLGEVRQHVHMGHLLQAFKHPAKDMVIAHPSQIDSDMSEFNVAKEDGVILMVSPFRTTQIPKGYMLVLPENNAWTELNGLAPKHIPNDPIGYVMAHLRISIAQAVEELRPLAREIQQFPDGPIASLEDFRIYVRFMANRALNREQRRMRARPGRKGRASATAQFTYY